MIAVKPDDVVQQHREDVVVYALPYADWNADLERPDNKGARVSVRVIKGDPVNWKAMPHQIGQQVQHVRVTGGSLRGRYEVVRVVKTDTEQRRKSFMVRVV